MKKTIDRYQFRDAFISSRPDNFSYEGLNALFDYLEEYEESCETEIELDVIAICCDFTECSIEEVLKEYNLDSIEQLRDNTTVIEVDDETVIYQVY